SGSALLAYFLAERELVAWVVTPDGIDVVRRPVARSELAAEVMDFRERLQAVEPVATAARALYDRMVRPVLARVPAGATLGIVPHGALHYLSFAALSNGQAYLVERHPLFYTP